MVDAPAFDPTRFGVPPTHEPALEVPRDGASCASCAYYSPVGGEHGACASPDYERYYGTKLIPLPADRFCSDWYEPSRAAGVRADAADPELARDRAHTLALVRLHRGAGATKRRGRVPRAQYPKAAEVGYAKAIAGTVATARAHARATIAAALPSLLASARAARGDAGGGGFLERELAGPADGGTLDRVVFAGLPLVIENRAGTVREWTDTDGARGATTMKHDYGYIDGTFGEDADELDAYRGPNENAAEAHVVYQMSKSSSFNDFDEKKVMLGFDSADDAKTAYVAQYNDPRFFGWMESMPVDELRARLRAHPGAKVSRVDAGEGKQARDIVATARKKFDNALPTKHVEAMAKTFGRRVSDANRDQVRRQARAGLGVDIATLDTKVPSMIEHFVGENVALIRSLSSRTFDKVEGVVTRGVTSGARWEDVADDIEDEFDVSTRHARLIARDQVGKLNGQLTAARHQELGVEKFVWRTAGDDRVRDEHEERDGEEYEYDDPPDGEIPGEPILCRCTADPSFEDILDELEED